MKNLLFEIGVEELPASYVNSARGDIARIASEMFEETGLKFSPKIHSLGTPRRLVLFIKALSEKQEDKEITVLGPPYDKTFDNDNKPTSAAIGFAKKFGLSVSELKVEETKSGKYVFAEKIEKGRPTAELLKDLIPQLIESIPFPKTMRWDNSGVKFARPIRWLMCLYGDEVIPVKFGKLEAGNITYGHRFLAPDVIKINSADIDEYKKSLKDAFVIVDQYERKGKIKEDLEKILKKDNPTLVVFDEALLDTVTDLVEYPNVLKGTFPEEFLKVPDIVLEAAMKSHQKYFPVIKGKQLELTNKFVFVSNMKGNEEQIIEGNERVLNARLADAKFFWDEDKKTSLEERAKQIMEARNAHQFGTLPKRIRAIERLAKVVNKNVGVDSKILKKVCELCKADLGTHMVEEFPELQGEIGGEYAREGNVPEEVSSGIACHYYPRFAEDKLPNTKAGSVVSISDKMNAIVSHVIENENAITGSGDKFALRRQAIGILRIILEREYDIDLENIIGECIKLYKISEDEHERVFRMVVDFFKQRLKNILISWHFHRYDFVDAVLNTHGFKPAEQDKILYALSKPSKNDFESITTSFKRISNILKQARERGIKFIYFNKKKLVEPEEKTLAKKFLDISKSVNKLMKGKEYIKAFSQIISLKKPLDDFFDKVMVMNENHALRNNRLAFLQEIENMFLQLANFSYVVTEKNR
ncbi:MAG: glycine--tRNA ligase subunit beta [bacterium]|nr:glycine--tRNA ligase subunit beta [bacterium]